MDIFRGVVIVGPLGVMGPGKKKCRVGVTRRVGMVRMEQLLGIFQHQSYARHGGAGGWSSLLFAIC